MRLRELRLMHTGMMYSLGGVTKRNIVAFEMDYNLLVTTEAEDVYSRYSKVKFLSIFTISMRTLIKSKNDMKVRK